MSTLDTIDIANDLEKSGFTRQQAEAIATAFYRVSTEEKSRHQDSRLSLVRLLSKSDLLIWFCFLNLIMTLLVLFVCHGRRP
jgi:hypothetical protein